MVLFFNKPLLSSHYVFPWDFRGVQLPLITFLSDELRHGRFPLWNPYDYCGYPVFANIEACFFHPLVLLSAFLAAHFPLDLPKLLEWTVVLQLWFAGVCAYHLLRAMGSGRAGSWAGAIIFQTGGYFASRAEHIGAEMAVAWMPLAWLAVWRIAEAGRQGRFSRRWFAALSAALGMAILGGFPQPTLAVFASAAMFAVVLAALRLTRVTTILWTLAAAALGIAVAGVQFIPTFQLTQWSVAKYRAGWLGSGGGLYWQSLVSLVWPNYYSLFDMSKFHGPGDISFLYLYSSIIGLALAIYALAKWERRVAPLVCMTAFGLVWMIGENEPLWRWLYPYLPISIRIGIHPEYTYCIFGLGLAGLAAMGLDRLRLPDWARVAIGIAIAADLFLVGSGRPMNLASLDKEPGVTDSAFYGSPEVLHEVRRLSWSVNPPLRIDTTEDASIDWSIQAPVTRVPTANGVSPLALEEVIQLRLFQHAGDPWGWYYPVAHVDSHVLDLMNVAYLITGQKGAPAPWKQVAALPAGVQVFENPTVMPRFFLAHEAKAAQSLADARRLMLAGNLRNTVITDRWIDLPPATNGVESVNVLHYEPSSIELEVKAASPSALVAAESFYPGWRAWIDGTETGIFRADIAFRGIVVPAGTHTVRMQFEPGIFPASLAVSGVGLLVLALLTFRGAYRGSGKAKSPPER